MTKRQFDWFAFRNKTAARICAGLSSSNSYYTCPVHKITKAAIEMANILTNELMESDDILDKIEKYEQKKKSRG